MKHSVSETNILGALVARAGGRVELAPEDIDVAVETLIQREQMLFVSVLDGAGAIVYDPVAVARVVVEVVSTSEAKERLRDQAEAMRAYARRQHELQHQRAAAVPPRPS